MLALVGAESEQRLLMLDEPSIGARAKRVEHL